MWIKQIRSFCYLKQIKGEKEILEFCIGMVDVPIKNPEKIKSLKDLVEALKSNISFTVFKNSSKRKLNLLKYITEREGGNTAKFIAEFRALCFDAEIIDLEEQKRYLFHALPNDFFRNTFINRKMNNINSLDDLIKMFEDIVQEESNLIRNGSCVAIKHVKTGKYLSSTTKYHQTGSGKQIIFAGQTLPDSDALWVIKASRDQISYNDMFSLQHKSTDTLIGRESVFNEHSLYNDYIDGDFADHVEVYCSTPSRTLQFNYHWLFQRINYTKYDSSYVRSSDIVNLRNAKDNTFLRSHEYQITIYNETFQEVISHDKKLEDSDEWCIELVENF
ncbi:8106_t:CDS:2 [Funneliformis geosporum]|uniref:8807_t:CDS:1 n=1 Tax=Funneliformis geosporum TaxID=1117311 RepID=A0A9W4WPQ6_9GLOM|nr:8106_t:CDS:2 [Funneliformis geosporum]CAI2169689.1 8807_t:CDS:2 [Funneliformis geosporum]